MNRSAQTDDWLRRLGLPPGSEWEQIQARYRELVLEYHPDVNPSRAAGERFRSIAAAYHQLRAFRLEQRAHRFGELARMYDDPKIRRLSPDELIVRLRYSSSPNVRAAAACLLGSKEGNGAVRRALVERRRDTDQTVRRVALESLGRVGRLGDLLRFLPHLDRQAAGSFLQAVRHASGRLTCRIKVALQQLQLPWRVQG